MKKFFVFLLFLAIGLGLFWWSKKEDVEFFRSPGSVLQPKQIQPKNNNVIEFEYGGINLVTSWFTVSEIEKITLHSNLESEKTAKALLSENNCTNLVSAGFYTKEKRPIGFFVSRGETVGLATNNELFNGFLSKNRDNKIRLSREVPEEELDWSLQSGPILIENGQPITLKIKNDSQERRVVAGITEAGEVAFFVLYGKESLIQGPYLADLPSILNELEGKTGIKLQNAINLDGGTASAFYSDYLSLSELTFIGSYFCVN